VPSLLAVDVGLRTGLAHFAPDGRLIWYRSQHFGSVPRLRRGVHGLLDRLPQLGWLVLEGGGPLADVWKREGDKRSLTVLQIGAERWRERFLYDRERRTASDAKHNAGEIARKIIAWSEAPRPTSLRHDAAEAIVIGMWGVLEVGLLDELPAELRR
jgi:hypothetical protein